MVIPVSAVVYTKSNCINCERTKDMLFNLDAPFETVNLEENPEAMEKIMAMNFRAAPVVVTDSDSWSGFNEQKIRAYARSAVNTDDVWSGAF